jgi:hypothetical protein
LLDHPLDFDAALVGVFERVAIGKTSGASQGLRFLAVGLIENDVRISATHS